MHYPDDPTLALQVPHLPPIYSSSQTSSPNMQRPSKPRNSSRVRIQQIKKLKSGSVPLETPSSADVKEGFNGSENLICFKPKKIKPRIVLFDVPNTIDNDAFSTTLFSEISISLSNPRPKKYLCCNTQ
ncbi:hypothetical protein WA026_012926 [Henosepilachna vigintioctopunctata]|uniref:Uncharacterized protein n=1 Tax=Henosepilachna vigintioctopunctata TaxID=420089 RepID=A0AAW1TT03_9CUCU